MTTHVTITNLDDHGGQNVVVNVVETESPRDEGKTVERHDLKPGESVTVRIYGWQRYVNVLEATTDAG